MKNLVLIIILSFGLSIKAQQKEAMFNACDKCNKWTPKQTAQFLSNLDQRKLKYKFSKVGPLVVLTSISKEKTKNYATFFEDKDSCEFYLSNFDVKCELLSFTIKH